MSYCLRYGFIYNQNLHFFCIYAEASESVYLDPGNTIGVAGFVLTGNTI